MKSEFMKSEMEGRPIGTEFSTLNVQQINLSTRKNADSSAKIQSQSSPLKLINQTQ